MAGFGDLNRVNTNVQALDAQLSLNKINRDLSNNQLRLSTGLRINRAEDDAAGYSIGTKLRSRVAGLEQALANVGDAKSVLDIAESSFSVVMDSLIEMKALATQAANGILGEDESDFIAAQITKLAEDIDKVSEQTVYQDIDLLQGGTGATLTLVFQVGERAADTLEANIEAVTIDQLFGGDLATEHDIDEGATSGDYRAFLAEVDEAITSMADRVNEIGMVQSSLSTREMTLSQAISANQAATSRIMDADFAKEQSESIRLQIMQQTATAALSQANMGPQSVLSFLG